MSRPLVSEVENQLTGKSVGIGLGSFFAIKVNGVFICLWQSFIRKSGETIISFLALQRLNMKHCFWCGPPVQAAHEETEEGYQVEGCPVGEHKTYKERLRAGLV